MFEFEYLNKLNDLIKIAHDKNVSLMKELVLKIAEVIEKDKIIHTFGTGHSHMIGIELFARAGGLGNVNAILDADVLTSNGARRSGQLERLNGISDIIFDNHKIEKGDIVIISSNSGRNSMPIEMALRCKKEGIYTVAVTNVKQSKKSISRHSSGKRLFEIVDCVLDTCVANADAMMNVEGILTGPASSIISMALLNSIITEAIKLSVSNGKKPYVFQSQNVDGFNNDIIYDKFEKRIKYF